MNFSFIIPLYNEEKTIRRCVEAIVAQMSPSDEIIVVDNGCTDNSMREVPSLPKVTVISRPGVTIAAVRNAGAAMAGGDILAFIDADCMLSTGWRDSAVAVLADKTVSATGAKVDIPDDADWIERVWYSQRGSARTPVSYINSGNLVIRKRVFQEVGGFLENLVTGEDSELGWRINRAGYTVLSDPGLRSVHLGNPKDLPNFYRKEKWHALGMMGTVQISLFNKPLIMTVIFMVATVSAILFPGYLVLRGETGKGALLFLALSLLAPVITALYRVWQFSNYRYFFHLVCLYWVYFIARGHALLGIIGRKFRAMPGSACRTQDEQCAKAARSLD